MALLHVRVVVAAHVPARRSGSASRAAGAARSACCAAPGACSQRHFTKSPLGQTLFSLAPIVQHSERQTLRKVPLGQTLFSLVPIVQHSQGQTLSTVPVRQTLFFSSSNCST